ncbi:2059_t:CDS:2, partial [Gigaspora margarita]
MEKNDYIKYLNNWYNKLRSRYVDLIGDFGGSELFVVEGDSLLYEFLCDPEKHFLNFIQPYGGGQFLSLTYLVETFLNKLKQRGCVFHLVFFNAHKVIWDCNPKFRIAREIIIDHLKSCQHKSKVSIYEFPAWWDPQFDQYIDDRQPLFILSGDGSAEDDIDDSKILYKEGLRKMSILLKGLFYHSLHKDLSMALIPGMEFRDSRAQAFVFDRGGNVEQSTFENIQNIVDLCSIEATNSNEHANQVVFSNLFNDQENQNALLNLLLNEQENQNVLNNGGRRLILAIISLITLLNQNSEPIYRLLSKLFLLHIYLLDYITLQLRTLPSMKEIDISNDNIINKFLESFYNYIRLFISLVQLQKDRNLDFNSLPNEIRQDFDIAWNILKHYDNNNIINFNGLLNNIQIEEHNIPTYANNELSLLPFNYPFFVKILGDMQLEFDENNSDIIDY